MPQTALYELHAREEADQPQEEAKEETAEGDGTVCISEVNLLTITFLGYV